MRKSADKTALVQRKYFGACTPHEFAANANFPRVQDTAVITGRHCGNMDMEDRSKGANAYSRALLEVTACAAMFFIQGKKSFRRRAAPQLAAHLAGITVPENPHA
jgi:hypothetical protein